jgi:hypothetical protein
MHKEGKLYDIKKYIQIAMQGEFDKAKAIAQQRFHAH